MTRKTRALIGLLILAVSLALLVWSLWPTGHISEVLRIPPGDLALPTP